MGLNRRQNQLRPSKQVKQEMDQLLKMGVVVDQELINLAAYSLIYYVQLVKEVHLSAVISSFSDLIPAARSGN